MRRDHVLVVVLAVILPLHRVAAQDPNTPTNRPSVEFTGTAYDIDYAPERTQVLIRPTGAPEGENLIGFLKSDMIQDLLQTSLVASRTVRVTHYGQNIIRAVLVQTPTLCTDAGCVTEVDCADFECTVVVVGESGRVLAKDRRVLGVLLTAINGGRRVEELIVDQHRNITRVKVNVPQAQERR